MSRIARTPPSPRSYVLRVLAAMVPELTSNERALIAACYADGMSPELVGEMLVLARRHGLKTGHAELVALIKNEDDKRKAGANAPASTRRGASRAKPLTTGDAHER